MSTIRHTRTRSAGIPIAANRPPFQAQTGGQTAGQASSASAAAKAAAGPPCLPIFLTNLKLLDLDLRPDWPGITAEIFAPPPSTGTGPPRRGTVALGQKKRIQSVEWALFHLFALWDPEETRNKLKPFFPPATQVQSTNLRAAILRALEQAKKNGVLGRDAIIRKTMLDECRGERLEEVLAAFSSAVLKKVISDQLQAGQDALIPVALGLSLEKRGYKDERTEINTLALAHRASLRKLLERKKAVAGRYRDFSDFLGVKERGLARRKEELLAAGAKKDVGGTIDEDLRHDILRQVRNNWTGNERWMDTLLYGDSGSGTDGLVGMAFDRVWRRVEQGRLAELEDSERGLLEQLEIRVRVQKDRLRKWDTFRKKSFGDKPTPSPSKQKPAEKRTRGIDLSFNRHESLRLEKMSPAKLATTTKRPAVTDEYTHLVHGLRDELAALSENKNPPLAFLRKRSSQMLSRGGQGLLDEAGDGAEVSDMSDTDEGNVFAPEVPISSFQARLDKAKRLPARPKLSHRTDSQTSSEPSLASVVSRERVQIRQTSKDLDIVTPDVQEPSKSRVDPADKPIRRSHDRDARTMPPPPQPLQSRSQQYSKQPPRPASPTQDLADQILESMDNSSPSPTKRSKARHTLSLAERTRLSMARGPNPFLEDDEPELPSAAGTITTTTTTTIPISDAETATSAQNEAEDLASRTRRSMAGFDKARQKAQMERRRSLRQSKVLPRREGSYFPKVEEQDEAHDQSALAEELMAVEDMEAVFKSRPKIKASPIPSPTKEWDDEYE